MFLRNWYNQFFSGKLKYQEFYKKLAHFSKYGMNIGSPISVDTSGESFLLQQLSTEYKSKNEFIFFDIGANKGEYTDCVLSKFNNCQLSCYLFEPQKKLFNALLDKYKNDSRLNIFPYGLGSNVEEVNLYTFNDINTLSSLYATFKGEVQATGVERISVIRLDQFLNENAISHISYINIDVEGHELEVLKGMGKYLSNGSIQRI
jgi:FkbM family methyltransferase